MVLSNTEMLVHRLHFSCCVVVAFLLQLDLQLGEASDAKPNEAKIDFNRDVRPILSDKCFFCHGPDENERAADLRLDVADEANRVIVPGKPGESELIARVMDIDDPMPPKESHKELNAREVELLSQWVSEGGQFDEPWAYVAPVQVDVPTVANQDWPINWIDQFVLKKLESEELLPSPDADAVTLVRRLSFDLTGLPPSSQTIDAFVQGRLNYDDLVDDLISSHHFGERMAVYWLDLVRYADTVGYHGDQDQRISPYRDYVIRSFNQNLPFDQFTREQLAGDLLDRPTKWQKVASGYNRLLQTSHEGGIQAKEYNAIYAADRIRNLSAVWMGATLGCAQCHDHKYDPYTIRDHYALSAFFADILDVNYSGNSLPTNRPPEMDFLSDELEAELASIAKQLRELVGKEAWTKIQSMLSDRERLMESIPKEKEAAKNQKDELDTLDRRILTLIPASNRDDWKHFRSRQAEIRRKTRQTMITVAKTPREIRVLPRGNWQDDSGDIVTAAVPEFLGKISRPQGERATRLDLANWLTDSNQGVGGLTARVFANRFWYLFFGTGISRSLSDFGGQGEPPANPELLDNLAIAFYESGWDVKTLVRLLVTSHAYRQTSVATAELLRRDPSNQLVARQSRFRLPAEMIRDNALAVSGLLVDELGGSSVKPYQPDGYYRHLNFPKRKYAANDDSNQWRRGVYVHWQRMFLHPMMKAMDAPSREECTAQRPQSNTPNAALVLLNDPTFIEAARALASNVITEAGDSFDERIRFAYLQVLSRSPDPIEIEAMASLLATTRNGYLGDVEAANELLEIGNLTGGTAIEPVELATWTAVARALLNMSETITRN